MCVQFGGESYRLALLFKCDKVITGCKLLERACSDIRCRTHLNCTLNKLVWLLSSVVAAVSKGIHGVGAQQTGHADRHPAGQRQHISLHPEQPLQREPRQRGWGEAPVGNSQNEQESFSPPECQFWVYNEANFGFDLSGVSAAFAVKLFKAWINEKDIGSVAASLRKVGMDNRLMVKELLPPEMAWKQFFWEFVKGINCKSLHRNSFRPTNGAASIFLSTSPTPGWRSCPTLPATSNPSVPARSCRRSSRSRCSAVTLRRRWG